MGDEIVGVGALENKHLDRVIGLGALDQGDQVADQFGSQQIHWRSRDLGKENAPFPTDVERLEYGGKRLRWRLI